MCMLWGAELQKKVQIWVLFFPFNTVNRWLWEKEVTFIVPSFVRVCVCANRCPTVKYAPTSITDSPDGVNYSALESVKGKRIPQEGRV